MPRVGAGAGDGLSTGAASALLGAQDAEYLREGTAPRRKAGQDPGAEDLLGRACCCRAAGLCALPLSLAVPLPGDGPPTGARSAGVVALLRLSTTPVAEAAHHQRGKRGSDYLCDFQSLQRGLEKPHPPTIYTSSLTSPQTPKLRYGVCLFPDALQQKKGRILWNPPPICCAPKELEKTPCGTCLLPGRRCARRRRTGRLRHAQIARST